MFIRLPQRAAGELIRVNHTEVQSYNIHQNADLSSGAFKLNVRTPKGEIRTYVLYEGKYENVQKFLEEFETQLQEHGRMLIAAAFE